MPDPTTEYAFVIHLRPTALGWAAIYAPDEPDGLYAAATPEAAIGGAVAEWLTRLQGERFGGGVGEVRIRWQGDDAAQREAV